MSDLPAERPSLWIRMLTGVSALTRASMQAIGFAKEAPARPGAAYGTVASSPLAQAHIGQIARSPTVYAANMRRARTFATYPMIVMVKGDRVDASEQPAPWVSDLLFLLNNPDPEGVAAIGDPESIAPIEPGEALFGQLIVDLQMEGVAYVLPTFKGREPVALTRIHPSRVKLVDGGENWAIDGVGRVARRAMFCIRTASWEANGMGELGTGAGEVLAPLVKAERTALERTADVIDQGGVDTVVKGANDKMGEFLRHAANRTAIRDDLVEAFRAKDGARILVLGGALDIEELGLKPADINAPGLLEVARKAELEALSMTPIAIGGEAGNYATAALQYRVQAELDEGFAALFEAFMLRPLAQHFARVKGKMSPKAAAGVTCRFDLSGHPGYAYARTEAIDRMEALKRLGYTTKQAADIEMMDFPDPEGDAGGGVIPANQPPPKVQTPAATSAKVDVGAGGEPAPVGRLAVFRGGARERSPEGDIPAGSVGPGRGAPG